MLPTLPGIGLGPHSAHHGMLAQVFLLSPSQLILSTRLAQASEQADLRLWVISTP